MFLLINKPSGPTSHDIINQLRKITSTKKIGHAGTLDPFASGLLIVAVTRESTKHLNEFLKLDKTYKATLKLGAISDTLDRTGKLITTTAQANLNEHQIYTTIQNFIGPQQQTPPMYSAKKIQGKKLYELARRGIEIKRQPIEVNIYNIKLLHWSLVKCQLSIVIHCTSGTYIRSLAHDIGQSLGCGAYLEELQRTKIGKYKLENAVHINALTPENWHEFIQNL